MMRRVYWLSLAAVLFFACLADIDLKGPGWCEEPVCPPPSELLEDGGHRADAGTDDGDGGTDGGGTDGGNDGGVSCPAGGSVCPTGAIACANVDPDWPPPGWELVVKQFDGSEASAGQLGVLERTTGPSCNPTGTVHMAMTGELRTMLQRSIPGERTLYLRAMYYLPADDPPLTNTGIFMVNGSSDAVTIGLDNDTRYFYIHSTPNGNYAYPTTPLVPADRWFCLEALVQMGSTSTSGRVELWLDGQSIFASGLKTANTSSTLATTVRIGLSANSQQTAPLTAYVDDIVVARERIGCL
jgi:hypothetical protein